MINIEIYPGGKGRRKKQEKVIWGRGQKKNMKFGARSTGTGKDFDEGEYFIENGFVSKKNRLGFYITSPTTL